MSIPAVLWQCKISFLYSQLCALLILEVVSLIVLQVVAGYQIRAILLLIHLHILHSGIDGLSAASNQCCLQILLVHLNLTPKTELNPNNSKTISIIATLVASLNPSIVHETLTHKLYFQIQQECLLSSVCTSYFMSKVRHCSHSWQIHSALLPHTI